MRLPIHPMNPGNTMSDAQRLYRSCLTISQLESIRDLNARNKTSPPFVFFKGSDVVDIVDDTDGRADMVTGLWFGMVIGVLPNGSCHS
jgi:hypothetical protein